MFMYLKTHDLCSDYINKNQSYAPLMNIFRVTKLGTKCLIIVSLSTMSNVSSSPGSQYHGLLMSKGDLYIH